MSKKLVLVLVCAVAACGDDPTTGGLSGTVTGQSGALGGVEVSAAGKSIASGSDGTWALSGLPAGTTSIAAVADWYARYEDNCTVKVGATEVCDFTMTEAELRVTSADEATAVYHNVDFDWTTDRVSIDHVAAPTRALIDFAVHYRNPVLYRDPSGEDRITPAVLPSVGTPASLDFEVGSGIHSGQQALDVTSVVDDVDDTPYGGVPADGVVLWDPALHYLAMSWNLDNTTPLTTAGVAVRSQKWDGTGILSVQELERTHLDGGDIWVEVVFQEFVDLDPDITDADGDGLREVWAKINPIHFDTALYAQLRDVYVVDTFGAIELGGILDENLDRLYSRGLNADIVSATGVPYSDTELGTVEYPFAVVVYGTVAVTSVFLAEP